MIDKIVEELNNDLTAITFDLIYNHSIISSLDLGWDYFDVYPPEQELEMEIENKIKYRKFRSNLHALLSSAAAFVDNFRMRLFITASMEFDYDNFHNQKRLDQLQEKICSIEDGRVCGLMREFMSISEIIDALDHEYAHSAKAELAAFGIANVHFTYTPPDQVELKRNNIETSLSQYLENLTRLVNLVLDFKEYVDPMEQKFNIVPFKRIQSVMQSGLQYARSELRLSAITFHNNWSELLNRLKDLSY